MRYLEGKGKQQERIKFFLIRKVILNPSKISQVLKQDFSHAEVII